MSVPEPVPIHSGQFERLSGWLELPVEQIAATEWGAVSSGEHQSQWSGFGALQRSKNLDTFRAERNAAFAPLVFRFIKVTFIDRLIDRYKPLLQINILPAKG